MTDRDLRRVVRTKPIPAITAMDYRRCPECQRDGMEKRKTPHRTMYYCPCGYVGTVAMYDEAQLAIAKRALCPWRPEGSDDE